VAHLGPSASNCCKSAALPDTRTAISLAQPFFRRSGNHIRANWIFSGSSSGRRISRRKLAIAAEAIYKRCFSFGRPVVRRRVYRPRPGPYPSRRYRLRAHSSSASVPPGELCINLGLARRHDLASPPRPLIEQREIGPDQEGRHYPRKPRQAGYGADRDPCPRVPASDGSIHRSRLVNDLVTSSPETASTSSFFGNGLAAFKSGRRARRPRAVVNQPCRSSTIGDRPATASNYYGSTKNRIGLAMDTSPSAF